MSSERGLAYALGWMVHIVGDSLIKSIQPGIHMHLLDGVYTPRNRIVQDQFTFHAIGGELEFAAMIEIAQSAGMRDTLVTIAEQCADLMEQTVAQVPEWRKLPRQRAEGWDKLKHP